MSTTTSSAPAATTSVEGGTGTAQYASGISLVAFLTALATSLVVFGIQTGLFLLLRNKLARIFKPKTYLVPERERTEPPPASPWGMVFALMRFKDREIIKKCGLDAYFFLRYLQALLVIFIPIALVVIPVLIPINFIDGIGHSVVTNTSNSSSQSLDVPSGLDTLAWGNLSPTKTQRRWAHLILALLVIIWVCFVFFAELRVYIKVRQDYLASAEHRLRASANTVLVSSIPEKWLTEEALRGLFDVFPGGIRNIWLTRDFTKLLDKIQKRDDIHRQLESAESDLIRAAKKEQLKKRKSDEKRARRKQKVQPLTKEEKEQREQQEDEEAQRRAEGPGGISVGEHDEVPHDVTDAVDDIKQQEVTGDHDDLRRDPQSDAEPTPREQTGFKIADIGGGLAKVGQGLLGGVSAVGKGAKALTEEVDGQLGRTGGFEFVRSDDAREPSSAPPTRGSDRRRAQITDNEENPPPTRGLDHRRAQIADDEEKPKTSFASDTARSRHAHTASGVSQDSTPTRRETDPRMFVNTTRKATNLEDMYITAENRWYEFWKPPPGGYASPIPQGAEGDEFPLKKSAEKESFWKKVKSFIPFMGEKEEEVEYPPAFDPDYKEDREGGAEWERWLKKSDRPHHRLPWFDWTPGWFPGFPLLHKKVDTIYWCRGELARLNMEIAEDQEHPERYPVMRAAFIQFNNQVAAHMACQSVTHHLPKQMTPRLIEISPNDVVWDNMAIKWWEEWARTLIVWAVVVGMVILWAFPVAWTASLSQIDALIKQYSWLGFLRQNSTVYSVVKAVAGVLPAIVLSILLYLVPVILHLLAGFQGCKTGSQKSEKVQVYYFMFLFVQVFLVVSITSSAWQTFQGITNNPTSTPIVLAENLPKAANYFFSYMILQAMSTSSGTLLQIGTLIGWFILARIFDNTARTKWERNITLPSVTWGSFFPVYTNFACIALIYSVVAPIISIFAIITFSLLWVANRYSMLYVTRFRTDTGGVLFPLAINQTFTGLYVMELCLVGLFFLQVDENGDKACFPQGIVMIVAMFLTAVYQILLNMSFGPLFRYLPITFEDEAVIRDEVFHRAQARRLGLIDDDESASLTASLTAGSDGLAKGNSIEMRKLDTAQRRQQQKHAGRFGKLNPVRGIVSAGSWAAREGKNVRHHTFGKAGANLRNATAYRQRRRQRDLEAQRAMGEALYGGVHDEIEDLTPDERDALVRKAFTHYALRARRPTVWIPRDDVGVSDDEVMRTREFSEYIWISNEGTALDSKVRVVYGRNPPDFSEVDIINL